MNMNSKSKQEIQDAFDDLFTFKNEKEKIKHKAHMLGFQFLSEIERVSEDRGLKKKDFAKIIGTSPSYITQLFRGDKLVNLETLAKFAKGLNIDFDIKIKAKSVSFDIDTNYGKMFQVTKNERKSMLLFPPSYDSMKSSHKHKVLEEEKVNNYEQQAA